MSQGAYEEAGALLEDMESSEDMDEAPVLAMGVSRRPPRRSTLAAREARRA